MKTSRVCAAVVATLAMFAAGQAAADTPGATGGTVVLNTYSKVWVSGDDKGPNRIGKNTGAGIMDASFTWDRFGFEKDQSVVNLATIYTRSDNQPNGNNSYMQGGVAFAQLTAKGVVPGVEANMPRLNGERAFMRPLVGFLPGNRALLIAAAEDNGVNNNPQPVAFVVGTTDGQLQRIPNSTRGNNLNKPTNLIRTATQQGINVNNPNNQRGPHTITQVAEDTFVVGMQYNNQAHEAFSITVAADNSVKMNWLRRYTNNAQHCRPHVAIAPGATTGYLSGVEANSQPADIGIRVTEFNVATGQPVQSKIVLRSQPGQNKYVSEPVVSLMGDKLALSYGLSSKVRNGQNGNGHAGGRAIHAATLLDKGSLSVLGAPSVGVSNYGRHAYSYVTSYGPTGDPALAVISGSSTGTGAGFIQMYPLKADGSLGVFDQTKTYQVSAFSDVANVQARGKRNPNDQARGFIHGTGDVPNPGFTTDPELAKSNFMPEVKKFSFSTATGYSGPEAMTRGLKNSLWLALVPAEWQEGLVTIPGRPTDKPGTNEDGTGPAPRSTVPGTDPTGEAAESPSGTDSVIPDSEDDATRPGGRTRAFDDGAAQSCSMSTTRSSSDVAFFGLAIVGVLVALRRKREEA